MKADLDDEGGVAYRGGSAQGDQNSQRPDALARTLFVLAMLGVVAFGGAVLMLLTLSGG